MTIDEAIKHSEEVARECDCTPIDFIPTEEVNDRLKCADEHRQLAEWLRELKKWREWLYSFDTDSATQCFNAVQQLKEVKECR